MFPHPTGVVTHNHSVGTGAVSLRERERGWHTIVASVSGSVVEPSQPRTLVHGWGPSQKTAILLLETFLF